LRKLYERGVEVISLTWEQINAWRMKRQYLAGRAERKQRLEVVSRLTGLHAQLMSAAGLALHARVEGLQPDDVEEDLWQKRSLVKTWLMRGTLHLVRADELPLFSTALNASVADFYRRPSWLKYHQVSAAEVEAILDGVRETLGEKGMTREELAEKLAAHAGSPRLRELLLSGWGALLKPAALAGEICFGPNQGQNVTFVHPERWLGGWEPVDPQQAVVEVLRRYLNAYGPSSMDEFGRWWGVDPAKAKKLFKALGDEVEAVEVEGWPAWALASSLEEMAAAQPGKCVRLLPFFDQYTIAVARHSQYLLPAAYKERVYRTQGWIAPVVLVNGRMAGVWEHEKQRTQVLVKVELFEAVSKAVKTEIEAEAQRIGEFLGAEAQVAGLS